MLKSTIIPRVLLALAVSASVQAWDLFSTEPEPALLVTTDSEAYFASRVEGTESPIFYRFDVIVRLINRSDETVRIHGTPGNPFFGVQLQNDGWKWGSAYSPAIPDIGSWISLAPREERIYILQLGAPSSYSPFNPDEIPGELSGPMRLVFDVNNGNYASNAFSVSVSQPR
jgi:hypothetical protein